MPHVEPLLPEDPGAVGPYRLVGRLGEGGQGVVYLAEAPSGGPVAVKVLLDGLAGDDRFAKEVAAARRVEPFCIAQVLDASLGGRPYIVTEYVDGPSLQQAGRHTGGDLQRLAVATATALAAIHAAGIVHRDFKPANVLLGRDGKDPARRPTMQDVLLRLLGGTANPLPGGHETAGAPDAAGPWAGGGPSSGGHHQPLPHQIHRHQGQAVHNTLPRTQAAHPRHDDHPADDQALHQTEHQAQHHRDRHRTRRRADGRERRGPVREPAHRRHPPGRLLA
jgi:serine/threonine protein kinase